MRLSITKVKADFSRLIRRAAAGEEIVITKYGRPKVVLRPSGPAEPLLRKATRRDGESSR